MTTFVMGRNMASLTMGDTTADDDDDDEKENDSRDDNSDDKSSSKFLHWWCNRGNDSITYNRRSSLNVACIRLL